MGLGLLFDKRNYNICNIYTFLWCIYNLQGTLYDEGGALSKSILMILFVISFFCFIKTISSLRLTRYLTSLTVFFSLLVVYMILMPDCFGPSKIGYVKEIFKSLLPIYPFYYFSKKGLINRSWFSFWIVVFVVVAISSFYHEQARSIQKALTEGNNQENFTNNFGYLFVALIPGVVLSNLKTKYKAIIYIVIVVFTIVSIKRGAILACVLSFLWIFNKTLFSKTNKHKILFIASGVVLALIAYHVFNILMETNAYFAARVEWTEGGHVSQRDDINSTIINYLNYRASSSALMFGIGIGGVFDVVGNAAHNDWLEVIVDFGLFGLVVYLFYWISLVCNWRALKKFQPIYVALGVIVISEFLKTIFSMSFYSMPIYELPVLAYCISLTNKKYYNEC